MACERAYKKELAYKLGLGGTMGQVCVREHDTKLLDDELELVRGLGHVHVELLHG